MSSTRPQLGRTQFQDGAGLLSGAGSSAPVTPGSLSWFLSRALM